MTYRRAAAQRCHTYILGLISLMLVSTFADRRHHRGTRLPVPTKDTLPLVAEELGAASFVESIEDTDGETSEGKEESGPKRVIRKLVTGATDELDASTEYQEYQGVIGRPGVDFPVLQSIPITDFSCRKVRSSGYYADLDTDCQVFHICDGGRKISFLCPNGTIFRQSHLICDWWFKVECERSIDHYEESAEQLAADQKIYQARAEAIAKAMAKIGENRTASDVGSAPYRADDATTFNKSHLAEESVNNNNKIQGQYFFDNPALYRPKSPVKNIYTNTIAPLLSSESALREVTTFNSSTASPFLKPIHVVSPEEMAQLNLKNQHHQQLQQGQVNYPIQQNQQQQVLGNYQAQQNQQVQGNYQAQQNQQQQVQGNYQAQQNQQQQSQGHYQTQQGFSSNHQQDQYQQTESRNNPGAQNQHFPTPTQAQPIEAQYVSGQNQPAFVTTGPQNVVQNNANTQAHQGTQQQSQRLADTSQQNFFNSQSQQNGLDRYQTSQSLAHNQRVNNINGGSSFDHHNLVSDNLVSTSDPNGYSTSPNGYSTSHVTSTTEPSFSFNEINENQQLAETAGFASSSGAAYSRILQQKLKSTTQRDFPATPPASVYYSYSTNHNSITDDSNNNRPELGPTTAETPVFTAKVVPEDQYSFVELLRTIPPNRTYQNNLNASEITDTSVSFDLKPSLHSTSTRSPSLNDLQATVNQRLVNDLNLDYPNYYPTPAPGSNNAEPAFANALQPFSDDVLLYDTGKKPTPTPSDPKLLHSLALYFATANSHPDGETAPTVSWVKTEITTNLPVNDGLSISGIHFRSQTAAYATEGTTSLPPTELTPADDLPPLLTKTTKDSYSFLFKKRDNSSYEPIYNSSASDIDSVSLFKEPSNNGLEQSESRGLLQGGSTKNSEVETSKIRDSVDLRELAKVFSRALSAYLEDPENFRRVLSEVRPTEPTTLVTPSELTSSEDEVLAFSEDTKVFPQRPTAEITPTVYEDFSSRIPDSSTEANASNHINNVQNFDSQRETLNRSIVPPLSNELTPPFTSYREEKSNSLAETESPVLFAVDVNNFIGNVSATGPEQYDSILSRQNVPENSYFPTAGGANDPSRPRYGGFHNNSVPESTTSYSPYGAGIAKQRTGQPLAESAATTAQFTVSPMLDFTETGTELVQTTYPASSNNAYVGAQDVNNLISNSHYDQNVDYANYGNNNGLSGVDSETARPTASVKSENLIASGSQSFVSRDNYLQYQNGFGHQTTRQTNQPTFNGPSSVTTETTYTYRTLPKEIIDTDRNGQKLTYKNVPLGNGVTIERTKTKNVYTASPTQAAGVSQTSSINPASINDELRQFYVPTTNDAEATTEVPTTFWSSISPSVHPTTYHPPSTSSVWKMAQSQKSSMTYKSPSQPIERASFSDATQATFPVPLQRLTSRSYDPQAASTRRVSSATLAPLRSSQESSYTQSLTGRYSQPTQASSTSTRSTSNSSTNFEAKAKEMFGNLNDTTADKLMDVMNEAESNVTLRRLVLLLVNDKGSRNKKTTGESRSQLIEALLKTSEKNSAASVIHPKVALPSNSYGPSDQQSTKHRKEPRRDNLPTNQRSFSTVSTASPATTGGTVRLSSRTAIFSSSTSPTQSTTQTFRTTERRVTTTTPKSAKYQSTNDLVTDSDSRAVELLKSLYTLAARWG